MTDPKILSLPDILRKLKRLASRKKIVFTNGCFDILHRGHVEYLTRARAAGDILIVGVNSNASVRRLKGSGRPLQPLADRAAVLAGLAAVDFVIPFSEDTPGRLIRKIQPDILVKGADWKNADIVGAEFVRSYGGRVVRIPLTPGRSTSRLIEKIRKSR
ncbi:D-glycero-beta-D-manno-heptose 1-phosphate adenylyltransferase [bacterium]|nr:D-glycero-beta-D-manno-heptose 1-phosphate adenylyltransferase [bacterium]